MKQLVIALILLLCHFVISAQEVELVLPGKLSLEGTHESIHSVSAKSNLYIISRADSAFKNSKVTSLRFRKGAIKSELEISDRNNAYKAGFALIPIRAHKVIITSNIPTYKPGSSDSWNLFIVDMEAKRDEERIRSIDELNSNSSECCLVMASTNEAYFSSNRDGSWDIFRATYSPDEDRFQEVRKVEELSSESDEWPSYLHIGGDLLLLSSIRKTGFGGDDIYFSSKEHGDWQTPTILSETINTEAYEDSGVLTFDGKWLYFSSRITGDSDIYRIKAKKTLLKPYLKRKN